MGNEREYQPLISSISTYVASNCSSNFFLSPSIVTPLVAWTCAASVSVRALMAPESKTVSSRKIYYWIGLYIARLAPDIIHVLSSCDFGFLIKDLITSSDDERSVRGGALPRPLEACRGQKLGVAGGRQHNLGNTSSPLFFQGTLLRVSACFWPLSDARLSWLI